MERNKLKGMVFAALFAALTGAVAWFKIPLPFTPVPITLQTLMVLLSGAMLGAYYGALAMIIYLILGAIGLPVFAGGSSGVAALFGPSGGYLLSYPIAAYIIGLLLEKDNTPLKNRSLGPVFLISALPLTVMIIGFILGELRLSLWNRDLYYFEYSLLAGPFIFITVILLRNEKIRRYTKYVSFLFILFLTGLVLIDSIFKIGFMKLWDNSTNGYVSMVSLISQQQRIVLIAVSVVVLLALLWLIYYTKRSKSFSLDTVLAMFAGTLIIYVMGSVQGKLVTGLPWSAIFVGWVLPFIIGDTLKLLAAAWIAKNIDISKYMK